MARDAKKNLLGMHDASGLGGGGSSRGGAMGSALSQNKSQIGGSTISKKDALKSLSEAKDL